MKTRKVRRITSEDFKKQVEEALSDLPRTAPTKKPVQKTASGGAVFLLSVLAILGGTWIYLINLNNERAIGQSQMQQQRPALTYQQQQPYQGKVDYSQYQNQAQTQNNQLTQVQSDIAQNRNEMMQLQDTVSTLGKRLAVTGALINENMVILRDNHPRQELKILQKDWALSSSPKYLKLTEEDKAFLDDWTAR